MKDMGKIDVILGIKSIKTSNKIVLTQSHYIKKILKMFNAFDSPLVKIPIDLSLHLSNNHGEPLSQLECL